MRTRLEFFVALREGLKRLPAGEIESAVAYYTEYFDEAGPENEAAVLEELGDPARIAQKITAEYMVRDIVAVPEKNEKKPKRGLSAVWIAVLAVFASPIALPVAVAIAALALVLVISAAAVLLALFCTALGLVAGGIFAFVVGCASMSVHIPTGVAGIGAGMACAGLGLLFFLLAVWLGRISFLGIARLVSQKVVKGEAWK